MRIDNGTEYESNEFNDFGNEVGIKRETTSVYTSEQNGVAERKNGTIVEAIRAMLCVQGLPKFLWGEVMNMCTFKIDARIPLWTPKIPKRFSLVRNLTSLILYFWVVPFIFMSQKRRGEIWMLMGRRECLWATVKL